MSRPKIALKLVLITSLIGATIAVEMPLQAAPRAPADPAPGAAVGASGAEPQVFSDVRHDSSLPLRAMLAAPARPSSTSRLVGGPRLTGPTPLVDEGGVLPAREGSKQATGARMPSPIQTFEGIEAGPYVPPDPNGDVGPNHYVESVNVELAIYDKSGGIAPGSPFPANQLFAGFGGPCEDTNDGDGIIQYDAMADRWVFSQFAVPNYPYPPFSQCFAVSQTPDPLGGWYRYEFVTPGQAFNDYPKIGVWPDAYYMTSNQFGPHAFIGSGAFAFDRVAMLAGASATVVYFQLAKPNYGLLPADVENASAPPTPGEPEHLIGVNKKSALRFYDFHVDFVTPSNSTMSVATALPVDPFVWNPCANPYECIPQKGTSNRLDPLTQILLYQLEYFNYGAHEDMVVSHTIKAGNSSGIRWYQLRSTGGGAWSVYQQGTHAPDGKFRWLPSGALDEDGNYAVGFNASSKQSFPSIRYAGRLESDPLGQLAQGEAIMTSGGGSQTAGYSRWGDYSSMQIDPSDGCTFWYTGEYYQTSSQQHWHTRVGTFKFPGCT